MIIKYMGKLYMIFPDLYATMEKYRDTMPSDLKEKIIALKEANLGAIVEISTEADICFLESISKPINLDMASSMYKIPGPVLCDLDSSDDPMQALNLLDALADFNIIVLYTSCFYNREVAESTVRSERCNHLIPDMGRSYKLSMPFEPKTRRKHQL